MELPKLDKPIKKQTYIFVKPQYLTLLRDKMGNAVKVGEAIGQHSSTISKAILEGKTRKVMEEAARGYYERNYAPKPVTETTGNAYVSMIIQKDVLKKLEPWLKDAGVSYKVF